MEEWKIIEEFPDYAVSNLGRIKRIREGKKGSRFKIGHILKLNKKKTGYLEIALTKSGKRYFRLIHRIVLETFIGSMNGLQVNHINGIKTDNRLENLEWCTHSENIKHAYKIGLMNMKGENNPSFGKLQSEDSKRKKSEKLKGIYVGEKSCKSKLKNKDIVKIRKYLDDGKLTQKDIGYKFGVSNTVISRIKTGVLWSHIKE